MPEGLPHVVRFPRACPRCAAINVMPLSAGTLAEHRTQVHLKCDSCRHDWFIEMTPPVLIVKPDRETDGDTSCGQPALSEEVQTDDRRESQELNRQRMRVGLCGLLRSTDRTHTVTVLYSLDARRINGRLRVLDPSSAFPRWLVPGSRLWLSGYDGVPLRIRITVVKPRREDCNDDEHFAEYVMPQVTQSNAVL